MSESEIMYRVPLEDRLIQSIALKHLHRKTDRDRRLLLEMKIERLDDRIETVAKSVGVMQQELADIRLAIADQRRLFLSGPVR